jgi:hypothetical protein
MHYLLTPFILLYKGLKRAWQFHCLIEDLKVKAQEKAGRLFF